MELTNEVKFKAIVKKIIAFLALASVIVILIDMTISIYEYVNVGILKHIDNYPWGNGEKEYWNYETPQIYSNLALTTSLCSIGILILNFFYRKKPSFILAINFCFLIIMGYIIDCKAEQRSINQDELRTTQGKKEKRAD